MIRKSLIIISLIVLVFLGSVSLTACNMAEETGNTNVGVITINGLKFVLNKDGNSYSLTGVEKITGTEIVIPEACEDKPVTRIGDYVFVDNNNFSSITIPDGVTKIGNYAFSNCSSLTSVNFTENSLLESIGYQAFYRCRSLVDISIPDGVTEIGESAFYGCSSLKSVKVPVGVTEISSATFYGCNGLESVYYDGDVSDWCNVTFESTTANPLYYANNLYLKSDNEYDLLKIFDIPDTLTEIKDYSFCGCESLMEIVIPENLSIIGKRAFYNCKYLTSVEYEGTKEDWNKITKASGWNEEISAKKVVCSDGDIDF